MNILILAAGSDASAAYPTWLAEIDGMLLLERLSRVLDASGGAHFVYAFRSRDIASHHVDSIASEITPGAAIVEVRRDTAGAACTALLAVDDIDPSDELIVASATDYVDADYTEILDAFRTRGAAAGVLTFESLHPRYSFVRTDAEGWVVEAAEKNPISRRANAGIYWYRRAGDFFDSLKSMILKDAHVSGTFYISPSLNELVLAGKPVAAWPLSSDQYRPLKDQRQLDSLEQTLDVRSRHAS